MLKDHIIVGVHITDRMVHAGEVQKILSEHGCSIKTRLGLHDAGDEACSPNGLLLIEFVGGEEKCAEMTARLDAVEGVETKRMVFGH